MARFRLVPGVLVGGVNNGRAMWSRTRFPNGDQVMVSMARDEAKLSQDEVRRPHSRPDARHAKRDGTCDGIRLMGQRVHATQALADDLGEAYRARDARESAGDVERVFNDPNSGLPLKGQWWSA